MNKDDKKEGWVKYLLGFATGNNKVKLWGAVLLSFISMIAGLVPYYCIYKIIDRCIDNTETLHIIVFWCLIALIAYIVKILFFSFSTGVSHNGAYNVLENLRSKLADVFLHAPLGDVESHPVGEIKSIMVDKIENIEPPLAHVIPEGLGHILLPLVSIIALVVIDWRIALASLVTIPFTVICMGITYKLSGKNFDKYNESNIKMNNIIVEYIQGIEVIKAFGRSGSSYQKYSDAINNYSKFVIKWMVSTFATFKLAFALFPSTIVGVLPVCLALAGKGSITAAQAVLGVVLSMSMVTSLGKLEVFSESLREVKYTVDIIKSYLEINRLPEPSEICKIKSSHIVFDNVCFSYSGKKEDEVLHNINLKLEEGSFTALVGPSGGGKSTVAKLISRFWDVTEGSISIGGINVKDMTIRQIADNVSFVTQDNFLFNCPLLENIRLGKPQASDEEVFAAARAAQCDDFISKLSNGYNTQAGEAGNRLSGGEKQRIAIARMILKNAPVIILDEATAFTDPENEYKIQKSISALTKGKTLLVIAHRLSTIKNADNIVVLKDGKIVSQGTQEELLENSSLYKNMWQAHIGAKNWSVSSQSVKEASVICSEQ